MMEPVIFHVDMDAFYASVEVYDDPRLRGKPVIVGGSSQRGVVSACSYEARQFGVHSAMPLFQARRLCPQGEYRPVRMKRYMEISQEIMNLFEDFSPRVIQLSVDEAFLDMTGTQRLMGPPEEAAAQLKQKIYSRFPLSLSVGIAPNHYLAKIASDQRKPDGLFRIRKEEIIPFLDTLPLEDLWGVGKKTQQKLRKMGLKTIPLIREQSLQNLRQFFGEAGGQFIHNAVRGIDAGLFTGSPKSQSISTERTLREDTQDRGLLETLLLELCQQVMFRLYDQNKRSATPFIKFKLADFTSHTAQIKLDHPVESAEELHQYARKLLTQHWKGSPPIRLIGAGLGSLYQEENRQQELFKSPYETGRQLEKTIWSLKKRYREVPISRASLLPQTKKSK